MKMLRLLMLLVVCSVYSQKHEFVPLKPVRSYDLKKINTNGVYLFLYKDDTRLRGKYNIDFFFLDKNKKDSLITINGMPRRTLLYDTEFSRFSRMYVRKVGKFNKGYKHGFWKTMYKNKLVKTANYNNGLAVGRYRVYNVRGDLLYKTTFGSKGNGNYKDYYYKTGSLKEEGAYKNGKKEGEWRSYNEQGTLSEIKYYSNGQIEGE